MSKKKKAVGKATGKDKSVPEIIFEKVGIADLQDYIHAKRTSGRVDYSLNEFVSQRSKNKDAIVVADLSNQKIGSNKSTRLVDLKGAVFIGSLVQNTIFSSCNLEGSYFCGMHLQNVEFVDSNIGFVDFRQANLGSCKFGDSYCYPPWNLMEGIKLSSKASCIRIYADIKNEIAKKNEQKRLLENKRLEMREVKKRTPLIVQLGFFPDLVHSGAAYRRVRRELRRMQMGIFCMDHMIHTSFQNVFRAESCVFDPIFLSGESFFDNPAQKKLVPLSRKDLIEYLQRSKEEKKLSLNDFAKENHTKSLRKDFKLDPRIRIIADLSSKVNVFGNNEWNRMNLSGLDFSNRDLSEVIFAGSNLSKSNFKGANLSNANFESTLVQDAVFDNTTMLHSNFYYADISGSKFVNSQLMHAKFDWSVAVGASFDSTNLEYLRAPNANWKRVKITNSKMSYSDFTSSDLRNIEMIDVIFRSSVFNKSHLEKAHFSNCDFSNSLFNQVAASHAIWDRCIAQNIEIRHSNLTGSKISEFCKFENADFSYSIMDGIKAPRAHFAGAILEHVKIGYGKFAESCFDGASLRFADLNSCVLSESSCIGADFTGAKLFNIRMVKSNLTKSILVGAEIKESSLYKANCKNSNWQSTQFKEVILDNVNNHRVKINDNTELVDCSTKGLDGQFYHYDEDAFMDIMFIEQLESNIQRIARAELLRRLGILSFVVRLVSNDYNNISRREVKRLHNIKLCNKKELKKYFKTLMTKERGAKDLNKFKFMNLFREALS